MMTFQDARNHDAALVVGSPTLVRWTNCNNEYQAVGTVEKINAGSIVVRLSIGIEGKYPAGQLIRVPRPVGRAVTRWTWNNTTLPIPSVKY